MKEKIDKLISTNSQERLAADFVRYDFDSIEQKWQTIWQEQQLFEADNDRDNTFYGLIEFPYPSGDGLHVGHVRAFCGLEVVTRMKRLQGFNVLFPIGWDAFGLPTENFAIATAQHPRRITDSNIANFVRQIKRVGFGFAYSRQIDTTQPDYYRWTQWIFVKMFEKGLAYKAHTTVNFCNSCQVVLANEDSQEGRCDRCNSQVVQKQRSVWFLKIRDYAERLLQGLDAVDANDRIKQEQINWIGKSEGLEIVFELCGHSLHVYTTRADTIFGVTFVCLAPEHTLIGQLSVHNRQEVEDYIASCNTKTEFERLNGNQVSGVKLQGIHAVNPISRKPIPVYIADYVMVSYGTGAVMSVPAHDARDYDFAQKYNIEIKQVVAGKGVDLSKAAYIGADDDVLINSGFVDGMSIKEGRRAVSEYCVKHNLGKPKTDYRMKDWAFNRQRYWGEPIPIVECIKCGHVALPESQLPLRLPYIEDFMPSEDGRSPLARLQEWVNTKCPRCNGPAKRETDTMPQWAGSSWYFLRYMSPKSDQLVDNNAYKRWQQVDWYNGGMEHVTRHLIYSRFYNQFLYDIGIVIHSEPYKKRTAQGLILGEDGEKMSKSRGNTVSPDDIVKQYGADVLRLFVMFVGDYEKAAPWNSSGIIGCVRFVGRVWALKDKVSDCKGININDTILSVTSDINNMKFNTAIAKLMTLVNDGYAKGINKAQYRDLLILLYPFAPHITEELWQQCYEGQLSKFRWCEPTHKEDTAVTIEMPVQINGKIRSRVQIIRGSSQQDVRNIIMSSTVAAQLHNIKKEIFVPDRIYNFIVE